jgi:hypothetical protein
MTIMFKVTCLASGAAAVALSLAMAGGAAAQAKPAATPAKPPVVAAKKPAPAPTPPPVAPKHCTDGRGNDAANSATCPGSKNFPPGPKSK